MRQSRWRTRVRCAAQRLLICERKREREIENRPTILSILYTRSAYIQISFIHRSLNKDRNSVIAIYSSIAMLYTIVWEIFSERKTQLQLTTRLPVPKLRSKKSKIGDILVRKENVAGNWRKETEETSTKVPYIHFSLCRRSLSLLREIVSNSLFFIALYWFINISRVGDMYILRMLDREIE